LIATAFAEDYPNLYFFPICNIFSPHYHRGALL
jgi:hypothetical protein